MKLTFVPHLLRFKRPFSIAHGVRDSTPVVFTKLEHNGMAGYGEASMPPYLGENHETAVRFLRKAVKLLEPCDLPEDPDALLSEIDRIEPGNTAAKASLDIALHDLYGKTRNRSCRELFGAVNNKELFTAYTIPIDEPEGIGKRIREAEAYKILKVKLGSSDDRKIIETIRKQSDKTLMVDANEGWTDKSQALDMIHWLAERNVVLVEQPLPKEMTDETAWLNERSPVPVIADEAVKRLSDMEKAKGVYSGINIKLMKCTGLNEARKMIVQARAYGMKIMLGCMSETSCGISAAAQIAPLVDWIDLDGPLLIREDYFDGVKFSGGKIILNDLPGTGITPLRSCEDLFQHLV